MRVRTRSACVVLAWGILLLLAAAGSIGSRRPAQANTRIASNTSNTSNTSSHPDQHSDQHRVRPTRPSQRRSQPPRTDVQQRRSPTCRTSAGRYVVQPGDTLSGSPPRSAPGVAGPRCTRPTGGRSAPTRTSFAPASPWRCPAGRRGPATQSRPATPWRASPPRSASRRLAGPVRGQPADHRPRPRRDQRGHRARAAASGSGSSSPRRVRRRRRHNRRRRPQRRPPGIAEPPAPPPPSARQRRPGRRRQRRPGPGEAPGRRRAACPAG